ncbi:MAG TPA: alpha/beta hydrolase [Phycisphaerales bacterium]|nr:alpha/beta hydrolase [Phycisphaerales bacterium]
MRWSVKSVLGWGVAGCMAVAGGCQSGALSVAGRGERVKADDGFEVMAYRFTLSPRPAGEPRATVLYIQGSEDRSVTGSMGALAGFCAMNAPVIAGERRGVSPDGSVDREVALKHATRACRVGDAMAVLRWGTASAPAGKPVVVLGASEGGDVAAAVAARAPGVTHVILLGSGGGWTQEEEFRHFVRTRGAYLDLKSEEDLDARVADIKAHPDADTMWAGHPYRRWGTFMFERAADDLLGVDCPILVVHGDRDESVPVEGARALKAEFERAGKTNLTLVEIPGADHRFADPATGASRLPLVEVAIVEWLGRLGVLDAKEVGVYLGRVRAAHPDLFPATAAGQAR